jgi:hypothetical protein
MVRCGRLPERVGGDVTFRNWLWVAVVVTFLLIAAVWVVRTTDDPPPPAACGEAFVFAADGNGRPLAVREC